MSDSTNPKDALGVRKTPLRFVPPALAIVASDAMADGAAKYGPFNWRETSVRLTVYLEAIERHVAALFDGQDRAEDSGHLHIGHIAACCAIIADAAEIGKLIDDRPSAGPAADMLRERDATGCEPGTGPAEHVAAFVAATAQPAPYHGIPIVPGSLLRAQQRAPAPFSGTPADVIDAELRAEQPHTAGIVGAKVRVTERNLSVPCGALGTIIAVGNYGVVGEFPGIGGTHYLLTGMFEVVA